MQRGEGRLTKDGALLVDTGKFTGRSVKDKFVVRDATTEDTINWGSINQPMTGEHWANLKADFMAALKEQKELLRRRPVRRQPAGISRERSRHHADGVAQPVRSHLAGAAESR